MGSKIDSYKYWMDQLGSRSVSTQRCYQVYLNSFCRYVGKSPDELIRVHQLAGEVKGDPRENQVVESLVRRWLRDLKFQGKKPSTRRFALAAIKSFFLLNLHPLHLMRVDTPQGYGLGSRIPEKEEVIKIADAGKWKYRAAVMFLKDSGLRCSDAVRLHWKDVRPMGNGFWNFNLITKKRQVQACSFIGPETTRLLDQFKTKTGRIFRTGADNFNDQVNWQIKAAGIEGVTAHGLRKYFVTSLEHARVPKDQIWFMCGKKSSVYSERRRSELFQSYCKAYLDLSLYSQREQQAEIERLRDKVDDLLHREQRQDAVLDDISVLMRLPGGEEFFGEIVDNVKKRLKEMQTARLR